MSIEENLKRLADSQERTATALEAILAILGNGSLPLTLPVTDVDTPDDQAIADAKAAEEAEAKKKAAAAAAKKKAEAEAAAAAKKKAEEEAAAAAAAIDPLDDAPADYTLEDVRKALQEYRAIEGAPAMMEILKTVGKAESLNAVKPENFAAIMAAVNVK